MGKKEEATKGAGQVLSIFRRLTPRKRGGFIALGVVSAMALCYLIFLLAYWGRIYPNITVGGVQVGGLTQAQAQDHLLAAQQSISNNPIKLSSGDKISTISPAEVGWAFDANASASQAYLIGRQQGAWRSFLSSAAAVIKRHELLPVVTWDKDSLSNKLSAIVGPINQPASDATAVFNGSSLTASKEKVGQIVDVAELSNQIIMDWENSVSETIPLRLVEDKPKIVLGDEAALKQQAATLAEEKITLKWPAGGRSLSKNEVAQMVDFIGGDSLDAAGQKTLTASFTENKVRQFLLSYSAADINQVAKEPKLAVQNGKVVVVGASSAGSVVDLDASTPVVLAALTSSNPNKIATLIMKAQNPLIDQNNISSLGLTDLIGEGTTSFAGSPADRTANINRGVQLLTSVLIKPGDEFSTLKNLSPIDGSNGFVQGLVIKDNRTVPDFGGGLCQVSTTLFRSVLAAGLKVTERQNHLYRVSYYEPPVGLDATIFDPAPDFKFLNDTPGYILIQGFVTGTRVTFDLWGTKDGRTASVSVPQILSTTPAGDAIYTNTDTLDKGVTKQIEHAHDGMVTTATYTVTKDGKTTTQVFKSIYKPWPAQFLVGTREPTAPTP